MKLEAGKTYIFKDEDCKNQYLKSNVLNIDMFNTLYNDGFTLNKVNYYNEGTCDNRLVIAKNEFKFFKLKDEPVNLDSLLATRFKILEDIKKLQEEILNQRDLLKNISNQLIKFFEDEDNAL